MAYKIMVCAQYFENYSAQNENWNGESESWKPKGGVDFVIDIDGLRNVATNDEIETAIKRVLSAMSNLVCRYELAGFEYVDADTQNLTQQFEKELFKILNVEAAKSGEVFQPIFD